MICFIIWVYSANWPPYRVLKTVVSSVSPSSEPSCKYFVSANRLVRFLRRAPENKCCFWVDLSVAVLLVWDIRPLNYHMTRSALRAQSLENYIEVDVCRAERIDISFSGKRRLDFTRTALLQKEDHWNDKKKLNFSMNFEFLVLTWKNKEIFFLLWNLFCGLPACIRHVFLILSNLKKSFRNFQHLVVVW